MKELETDLFLFADDVLLLAEGISQMECGNALNPDILRMMNWSKMWKISLNPDKTSCLTITRTTHSLDTRGKNHTKVRFLKHLGVYLESDLKWQEQMDSMISRAELD